MINIKAHKILKILYKHFNEGEKKTRGGHEVTPIGRSFTTIELNNRTQYSISTIEDICYSLEQNKYIEQTGSNQEFKIYRYCITPEGINAYITKHYIYSLLDIIVKWIPILVSVLSLMITGAVGWYTIHNGKSIEKLQNQTVELQKKIKALESHTKRTN